MIDDLMQDSVLRSICQTQAIIYEYAALQGYDMEQFSNLFLASDFCKRQWDTLYSRYQLHDAEENWDFIYPEIGDKLRKYDGDLVFDYDIAYWIGFTYRQLFIETEIPSSVLLHKVPFEDMWPWYPGLHTVDERMATDIICECKGLNKIAVTDSIYIKARWNYNYDEAD